MSTGTYYNPKTNEIRTGSNYCHGEGFVYLGSKKIAEAFTTVDPEERPALWLALHGKSYGIDLRLLNSKIRHKLKKIGIDKQFCNRCLSPGENLLSQILKKSGL